MFRFLTLAVGIIGLAGVAQSADDFKLEDGFTEFFNAKDFTGWKAKKGDESLDGKGDAYDKRFVVKDGGFTIDPKVKGDVRIVTAKALPKSVVIKFEFFPGKGCNNDLFLRGIKFDINPDQLKMIKLDEWNQFEWTVTADKSEIKINGEAAKSQQPKGEATPLEIRAEFGPIQFRRLRFKEKS